MKSSIWSVIAFVALIMGFLMGYSTAPMIETGMLAGRGAAPGPKAGISPAMRDYYKDLYKEE